MRGNGDVGRVADDFIRDTPFPVRGIFAREVERTSDDAHGGVVISQATAKVLEVRPVVSVEAISNLRAHVA